MAHPELPLRVVNVHSSAIKRQQASWNIFAEEKKGEAKGLPKIRVGLLSHEVAKGPM